MKVCTHISLCASLSPFNKKKLTFDLRRSQILYSKDSFDKDRKYRIDAVYSNIVNNMRALLDAYLTLNSEKKVPDLKSQDALKAFDVAFPEEAGMQHKITEESAQIIMTLWNDPSIQKTYEQRALFQISDSTDYFFNKDTLARISAQGYLPSDMDVLRTRVRTSGIIEHSYVVFERTCQSMA